MSEENQEQLIMGKYKTQEDLINGYKNLQKSYNDVSQQRNKFTVPTEYNIDDKFNTVPKEKIESVQRLSQEMGFTQEQFDKHLERSLEANQPEANQPEPPKQPLSQNTNTNINMQVSKPATRGRFEVMADMENAKRNGDILKLQALQKEYTNSLGVDNDRY